MDGLRSLQYCAFMGDKHLSRPRAPVQPFWLGSRFQRWKCSQASSLIMIKGSYLNRLDIKGFCANVIEQLRESKIPVVWALKAIEDEAKAPSPVDMLKDLVAQVLRLNIKMQSERCLTSSCTKFHGAETENEWLDLLGSLLDGFRVIYIVIDIEVMSSHYATSSSKFSLPSAFLELFEKMSARSIRTDVKVVLVSYGSLTAQQSTAATWRDLVIPVNRSVPAPRATRGKLSIRQRDSPLKGRGSGRSNRQSLIF